MALTCGQGVSLPAGNRRLAQEVQTLEVRPPRTEAAQQPATATALESVWLQPADLKACLALDGIALGGFWTADQWRTELAEPGRPCCGLRGSAQLLAVACGWLVVDELHITLVAVHPDWRRRGLGRRVLSALLQRARSAGACHATLEVAAGNGAAQSLYSRCGFRTAGVRRRYYRDGDDALVQWTSLERQDADQPPG